MSEEPLLRDPAQIDHLLSLHATTLGQAAHVDDVRVNISLLVITVAAGAVPAIAALSAGLQRLSAVMLLAFGVGLTALQMHYARVYSYYLEYADKLLQLAFLQDKQEQKLDYLKLKQKMNDTWVDETSFLMDSLNSGWFYATAVAGLVIPVALLGRALSR